MPTKVREAIRMIEDDGWVQVKATAELVIVSTNILLEARARDDRRQSER